MRSAIAQIKGATDVLIEKLSVVKTETGKFPDFIFYDPPGFLLTQAEVESKPLSGFAVADRAVPEQ